MGAELSNVEVYKVLYQGQPGTSAATVYTAPAATATIIKSIHVVNTNASITQTFQLFVGGTTNAQAITPSFVLPAGGAAVYDGESWDIFNNLGQVSLYGAAGAAGDDAALTFSGARVYATGNQVFAASTWTSITFNAERYDTTAYHDIATNTSRLTIPATGKYAFGGMVTVSRTQGAGPLDQVRVLLNGTTVIGLLQGGGLTGSESTREVVGQYAFTAADYIELQVYSDGASTTTKAYDSYSPEFWISTLGGAIGPTGLTGNAGQGVPVGGTTGQSLTKINGTDYNTQWSTPAAGGSGDETLTFFMG